MVTNTRPDKDMALWKKGVQQLKKLDCGFCAIYGAEPLEDFEHLPAFVAMLSGSHIESTVITSCVVPQLKQKLTKLYNAGLRSLTVSYDGDKTYDESSAAKTKIGIKTLRWFRDQFSDLRDVAIVVTINRRNYKQIPDIVRRMTKEGIWTLFDFIHPDRGQPGSKCRNTELTKKLLFQEEDLPGVVGMLEEIKILKEQNHLVHWSNLLLDYMKEYPKVLINYDWHCVEKDVFPSWITVENTGEVYCCDDFHIINDPNKFYLWEIADRFEEFTKYWMGLARRYCRGCIWNTHWDANAIKRGTIPFSDYVHYPKYGITEQKGKER